MQMLECLVTHTLDKEQDPFSIIISVVIQVNLPSISVQVTHALFILPTLLMPACAVSSSIKQVALCFNYINGHGISDDYLLLVECKEGSIRLAGGENDTEGRIEICHNDIWGTVCDAEWNTVDAEVLCYQLEFQAYG